MPKVGWAPCEGVRQPCLPRLRGLGSVIISVGGFGVNVLHCRHQMIFPVIIVPARGYTFPSPRPFYPLWVH